MVGMLLQFADILKTYQKSYRESKPVIAKLEEGMETIAATAGILDLKIQV